MLQLENGSTLSIDSRNGPVFLYVATSIVYGAKEVSIDSSIPALFLGYFGTRDVALASAFNGVFLAPNATLHLHRQGPCIHEQQEPWHWWGWPSFDEGGNCQGDCSSEDPNEGQPIVNAATFYANNFFADPGETVTPTSFDWTTVPGLPPPPGGWVNALGASGTAPVTKAVAPPPAVQLNVTIANDGSGASTATANPSSPVPFTLPGTFEAAGGEIANGTVILTFTSQAGAAVTCTYQGGAPTATPTTQLDLNAGRDLNFVSCSDGLGSGVKRFGTNFSLNVNAAPGWPVQVNLPLDDRSCAGTFSIISAYDTRRLHDSFHWSDKTAVHTVDEHTSDGKPTLYYAWVYVRDRTDMLNLEKMYVHVLHRPLFTQEIDQYAGLCGTFTNTGDGTGQMVPVLLPGLVYNNLVKAAQDPGGNNIQGSGIVFDAVILRNSEVPSGARNSDGSVNLTTLARSGFKYLDYEPQPLPSQADIKLTGGSAAAQLIGALQFVFNAVSDIGDTIQKVIGDIDTLFVGYHNVSLKLRVLNPDSYFTDGTATDINADMLRGWGPTAGAQLGAGGLQVEVMENVVAVLPAAFAANTDDRGWVTIQAASNGSARGSGLCIKLSNSAADMTGFLATSELCDFASWSSDTSNRNNGNNSCDEGVVASPGNPAPFALCNFSVDHNIELHIQNGSLAGMYEMTDAHKYINDVAGYTKLAQAHAIYGAWANTFSFTGGRAFTPCLYLENLSFDTLSRRFNNLGSELSQLLSPQFATDQGATLLASILGEADIILPDKGLQAQREVGTHEYGHFALCNFLNDVDPASLDAVIFDSIVGFMTTLGDDYQFPTRYINEAFADFISGQVTSIANYAWLQNGGIETKVCSQTQSLPPMAASQPCFDQNDARTTSTDKADPQQIGRIATLMQDAFDGHQHRCGDVPDDGLCQNVPNDADAWTGKEQHLSYAPSAWGNFDGTGSKTPKESVALPGSSIPTLIQNFATSAKSLPGSITPSNFNDQALFSALNNTMLAAGVKSWCQRCQVFALHTTTMSTQQINALSARDLLEVCNGGDSLISSTLGAPPDANLRLKFSDCSVCPDGTTSDADGKCQPCPTVVEGNTCVQCPYDAEIDGTNPLTPASFKTTLQAANDTCPDIFWLQIDHPDGFFNQGVTQFTTTLALESPTTSTCTQTYNLTYEPDLGSGFISANDDVFSASGTLCTPVPPFNFCLQPCSGLPSFTVNNKDTLPQSSGTFNSIRYGTPVNQGMDVDFSYMLPVTAGN